MSRLVTSSPHSGSTTVSPAAVRSFSILPKSRNSSSYLTVPRPLTIATTRLPASSGLSARSRLTSSSASSEAVGMGCSEMPGSPWMPRPRDICPAGTVNSGASAPGSVQPSKATPRERVR